ncbi:MAG: 2-isopropylmalate synthase [Magnetococcales bacterium]|nr:2-isopropylmalate synthase [Magnetococcales bacterium]MBF0323232.1 2-isopropylmalate synthase [Magnetococcales bacterium]
MLTQASRKYQPAPPIPMAIRQWPANIITQAPRWCSIDLRDGNQALATPMRPAHKASMYHMLIKMGFREIEAGFPAASQDDFDFIRHLVDVATDAEAIQVLTSARSEHIQRTFAALQGMPRAVVHFYISTSPQQRRLVFGVDEATLIQRAIAAADIIRSLAERQPDTQWSFEFTPESFTATEPEFALAICEAVIKVWEPTPEHKVILNLPATVEVASPNRYADQIEWFGNHISRRDAVVLSIHPHNDRGCAVAAAELALLAGAERVEGSLFGNGERTGNLDLVTLAMNLHSQGIATGLDFSNMPEIAACYQACTRQEVTPRHPYVGELVFTAFSGSHQDAIRKGLAAYRPENIWDVPYLPVDPRDLGFDLSRIVRVNSQSGKAGAAFLLEQAMGIILPRWLEPEFASEVQRATDQSGQELTGPEVAELFAQTLLHPVDDVVLNSYRLSRHGWCQIHLQLTVHGVAKEIQGEGNGPIDAACHALPGPWQVQRYEEHALDTGSHARAISFMALKSDVGPCTVWSGAGIHEDIVAASLNALVVAINRSLTAQDLTTREAILARW